MDEGLNFLGERLSGFDSLDLQMLDVLAWLDAVHEFEASVLRADFPELAEPILMFGSSLDIEAMGVNDEFLSWVIDGMEATGLVTWWEGEPWEIIHHP